MDNNFKIDIISPEKVVFSGETDIATLPSYEGDMSILKGHISIITFLKPGIIKIQNKKGDFEIFFVQDGTVEFFNDALVILSSSAINIKDLSKEFIEKLHKKTEAELADKNITDHDRYVLNHKLDAIKEIRV
tara:strand:+ start:769 stop:1164 length:396 start_codon:yes stop_codon:yes gene_type:complete